MTQTDVLDTVLLLALPASGKSEVRRYLDRQPPEVCGEHFHMGPTLQLDDYPYVHLMRRVDELLETAGRGRAFFVAEDRGFQTPLDWGTLIELVNEDFADLQALARREIADPVGWLLDRYDRARGLVGAEPAFADLDAATRAEVFADLKHEVVELIDEWNGMLPDKVEGHTIVIEFARGGAHEATMPLGGGMGYGYSLGVLSKEILSRSSILYIWVTPEQSRQKNDERARPDADGSILFHGVPLHVMMNDYGCDDLGYLLKISDRPGTVRIARDGATYYLPCARFDNRDDLTTFVREDEASWAADDVAKLRDGLAGALDELWQLRTK